MIFIAITILSVWSISLMSIDFLPDIKVPKLTVISSYGGLPANEIRELLTIPVEDSFSSLKGIKHINSISRDGLSIIELEFHWGTDMVLAGVETREVIDLAYLSLPSEASKPQVLPIDPNDEAIINIGVFHKSGDLALARRLAEREIKSRLQQRKGVGTIQVSGGLVDEIKINLDQSFINAKGLTVPQVSNALASGNISYPAGVIEEGNIEYIVKTDGKADKWQDLGQYYVEVNQDTPPVQIKELGTISRDYKDQRSFFHHNGKEGVLLSIRKQAGTSPVSMAEAVKAEIDLLGKSYGKTLEFTIVNDTSAIIERSITDLSISALLGAIFAFIILYIFLKNIKNSLLLIITLPVSISCALLLLSLTGKSINIMSLGGLAMGIGMLVDNAIVIMERLSTLKTKSVSTVVQETASLAGSLTGSTMTSLVVFFPILFLPGLLGSIFSDLALAVIFSLSASLIVAITLIPVLFLLWGNIAKPLTRRNKGRFFVKIFKFSFRSPGKVIFTIGVLFTIGYFTMIKTPFVFLPSVNQGYLNLKIEMPPGTSVKYMKNVSGDLSSSLMGENWIDSISIKVGGESNDPYYLSNPEAGPEILHARINYNSNEYSYNELSNRLMAIIDLNQGEITVQPPADLLSGLLGLKLNQEKWFIFSHTPEDSRKEAEAFISSGNRAKWKLLPSKRKSQIILSPDREILAKTGMDISSFSQNIGSSLFGSIESSIFLNGSDVDIKVQLMEDNRNSVNKLNQLNINSRDNKQLKLEDLVEVKHESNLPYLTRRDRKDVSELIYLSKSDKVMKKKLKQAGMTSESQSLFNENIAGVLTIFALSAILLYLTLGAQFESFSLPLLLMLTLPLSFSGITIALFLSGSSLNLNSILGILVLMGISVNNSILLYETFQKYISGRNSKPLGSIFRGTMGRIRPIMMTMLTTTLALVPLAVDPFGTSTQSSMAISIIGGLTVSTILSLVIIPGIFFKYIKKRKHDKLV